ncbi:MAG: hypothetical protein IT384_25115 [Deltaproteobacteria bacterium]|nr:hypothetical protein [Deltaproteobacteria bacterium]
MRRLAFLMCGLALSCQRDIIFVLPPELTHAALLRSSPSGVIASPLRSIDDAWILEDIPEGDLLAIGYTADALAPAIDRLDEAEALVTGRACGGLPRDRWSKAPEGEAAGAIDPATPLHASWICPNSSTRPRVVAACSDGLACRGVPGAGDLPCSWSVPCEQRQGVSLQVDSGVFETAKGCFAEIERPGEQEPPLRATLDTERWSDGYHASGVLGTQGDPAEPRRCVIDARFETTPPMTIPLADQARFSALDVGFSAHVPQSLFDGRQVSHVDAAGLHGGGVTGLVLDLERRRAIAVVSPLYDCTANAAPLDSTWQWIDIDSPALTASSAGSAPACLLGLHALRSPQGGLERILGFQVFNVFPSPDLAAQRSRVRVVLHEFDRDLTPLRQRLLWDEPVVEAQRGLGGLVVSHVADLPGGDVLVSLADSRLEPNGRSHVLRIDRAQLVVTATLTLDRVVAGIDVDPASDEVRLISEGPPATCSTDRELRSGPCTLGACSMLSWTLLLGRPRVSAFYAGAARELVFAGSGNIAGLWDCARRWNLQPFGDGRAHFTAVAPLRQAGRLLAAAVHKEGDDPDPFAGWVSELMIADLDTGRFEPQIWRLPGTGVSQIEADDRGRLWLVLPWSGMVVRWADPTR